MSAKRHHPPRPIVPTAGPANITNNELPNAAPITALRPALEAGIATLGLHVDEAAITRLLDFIALLQKWNRIYNLTAVRDSREMLTHHILDSLAAVAPLRAYLEGIHPHLPGPAQPVDKLLDVGSGGGLPAVVFAICFPALRVDCVDAVAKKAAFLQQTAAHLHLPNLRGIHARVQDVRESYPLISSRAFASLADFTAWSAHALSDGGLWLALKGKTPVDEITALPSPAIHVFHVEQLTVPGLDAQRCLVWLGKDA